MNIPQKFLLFMIMIAGSHISYSQKISPKTVNYFCYSPQRDIFKSGSLGFYISQFTETNLSGTEFTITDDENNLNQFGRIYLTVDKPFGSQIVPAERMTQSTIRITNTSFILGKNAVSIYINGIRNNQQVYAGPITILSSNGRAYSEFHAECPGENAITDTKKTTKKDIRKDTTMPFDGTYLKWKITSPDRVQIRAIGSKEEVFSRILSESYIVQNRDAKRLLQVLNPGLSNDVINSGTYIRLPKFAEVTAEKKKQFDKQYSQDIAVDVNENTAVVEKINMFYKLEGRMKAVNGGNLLLSRLSDLNRICQILITKNLIADFKKVNSDLINAEMDNFNDFLLDILINKNISKDDIDEGQQFNDDMCDLINPLLGRNGIKRSRVKMPETGKGGLMMDEDNYNEITETLYDDIEPEIPVFFYIFEADGSPSPDLYWVYCVPDRAYKQLMNKKRTLQSLDVYKSAGMASTSYKTLETTWPRHFFAITDDGKIFGEQFFEVKDILKDSKNPKMTDPYSFPIIKPKN